MPFFCCGGFWFWGCALQKARNVPLSRAVTTLHFTVYMTVAYLCNNLCTASIHTEQEQRKGKGKSWCFVLFVTLIIPFRLFSTHEETSLDDVVEGDVTKTEVRKVKGHAGNIIVTFCTFILNNRWSLSTFLTSTLRNTVHFKTVVTKNDQYGHCYSDLIMSSHYRLWFLTNKEILDVQQILCWSSRWLTKRFWKSIVCFPLYKKSAICFLIFMCFL